MALKISTADVPARDRFGYWRDVICDAYLPIGCETAHPETFEGAIELERMSRVRLSFVSGSPRKVLRAKHHIARDTDAYFLLSLQLSRRGQIVQAGRVANLGPGDCALYSTTDVYEICCPDEVEQLVLQLPAAELRARVPQADLLTAQRIDGRSALGGMLSSSLLQVANTIGEQSPAVQQFMQDMLLDLVATGLASIDSSDYALSHPEQLTLNRAHALILERMSDPDLDRDTIAAAMGLSVRSLSRLFARYGRTVSSVIRETRLDKIAEDLLDPRLAGLTVSEISCKWGINNFQHLSRIFRERFGQSPRDYRTCRRAEIHQ